MSSINYLEAIVVGALQGVSELFPVSSLGHSVLLPALVGGRWASDLSMAGKDSPYLAVLVAMHVATALALVVFFWQDWVRLVRALLSSIRWRRIRSPEERLVWLLIVGTIPVGLAGLALESLVRGVLGKPIPSAIFLAFNGLVLYLAERGRSAPRGRARVDPAAPTEIIPRVDSTRASEMTDTVVLTGIREQLTPDQVADRRLSRLSVKEALLVGAAQSLALLPGISRSGITIVAGLARGMRHGDAARFAFLLSTPVILAAGVLKLPSLLRPENHAVLGPALFGSLVAGLCAYVSVRFLTSYFETRTLTPFAVYCAVAGVGSLIYLTV